MLFQDSKFLLETIKIYLISRQSIWDLLKLISLISYQCKKPFNRRLSVEAKIKYGYSLVIGIAILGTSVGTIAGDYYKQQTLNRLTLSQQETKILADLENAVIKLYLYHQQLLINGDNYQALTHIPEKISQSFAQVDRLFLQLKYFQNNYSGNSLINQTNLQALLNEYKESKQLYNQEQLHWQPKNKLNLKAANTPLSQSLFFNLKPESTASKLNANFEQLISILSDLKTVANLQEIEVSNQVNTVSILRLLIILASIIISVGIATLLGFHSSRQIVRPLEWVHQVALRVTQQANFKLVAPVLSEDEVGSLASSMNKLVQWVGEYTQELETARQTLEEKVAERTQELEQTVKELKQTQAQLIQNEKMISLGNLVAGIAHEINNPTNFIYGNIQHISDYVQEFLALIKLYQKSYRPPIPDIEQKIMDMDLDFIAEDLPKILDSMKFGTERIRSIIISLRNFSRLDEAEMKLVDIHEGIESTLVVLSHHLKREVKINREYNNLPFIECFPAQINQVILHIISNAIDALKEAKSLKAARENNFLPEITIKTQQVADNLIQIRIGDNGNGIAAEIKDKIFDPFFTTKAIGKGSGLGLFVCYNVVQKHQGKLEVISELERGTEFVISLPIKVQQSLISQVR
ncbi:ATP-binding protein [Aerosakkonemataceae cyanobacterium BLCC-F154]|uniref:histidine kinase n=1 Tax=Floridaenema fluviatile BLCC-F154 TaxID=3153640 RepID=A0ABV4YDH8_9CYAN